MKGGRAMEYNFRIARKDDISRLIEIESSWENHYEVSGHVLDEDYFVQCLDVGDLPPIENASKDNYGLYVIEYENKVIAFFDFYRGYPKPNTGWISIFIVDKGHRRDGHGRNIITRIEKQFVSDEISSIAIAVDLKNYSGLKFWTKIGFKNVIGVFGDDIYSSSTFAVIALTKEIDKSKVDIHKY